MPRTRWPVNKSLNLPVPTYPLPFPNLGVEIESARRHLDRIQISVLSRYWKPTLDRFKARFGPSHFRKYKGRAIWKFKQRGVKLSLVRYPPVEGGGMFWFSIGVSEPDEEIQLELLDALKEAIEEKLAGGCAASLTQVEFALDFFPKRTSDLPLLSKALEHRAVLKYSRTSSCSRFKSTHYQGKEGNVRTGSKGLRCYPKHEAGESFVRIELQANRHFLRRNGLDIDSLPLTSDSIDAFNFISFREGLNNRSLEKLTKAVTQRHWPNRKESRSKMANMVRHCCIREMILSSLGHSQLYHPDLNEELDSPVSEQICAFKRLKKKYGLTLRVERLFSLCS